MRIPENEAVARDLGYPFEVSNADSLENKLQFVITHQTEAIAVEKKAKKVVRENHDWSKIAGQYNEVYIKLRENLASNRKKWKQRKIFSIV